MRLKNNFGPSVITQYVSQKKKYIYIYIFDNLFHLYRYLIILVLPWFHRRHIWKIKILHAFRHHQHKNPIVHHDRCSTSLHHFMRSTKTTTIIIVHWSQVLTPLLHLIQTLSKHLISDGKYDYVHWCVMFFPFFYYGVGPTQKKKDPKSGFFVTFQMQSIRFRTNIKHRPSIFRTPLISSELINFWESVGILGFDCNLLISYFFSIFDVIWFENLT